jgi:POT family proton-dependent oligopeptide transporter
MRSILVIFMVSQLAMQEHIAERDYHLFMSACYLLPLLGAYISDRYWGKYRTIITLSLVYCMGHFVLSMWETRTGLYWGLGLIALGSGGIKPCVSAYVGDQFNEKNKHLVQKVFDVFYWFINFGSFFSSLLIPWVLPTYGSRIAFGIPGILMAIATYIFWRGRKQYVHVPPTGKTGSAGFVQIFSYSLLNWSKRDPDASFLEVAKKKYKAEDVEGVKAAWDIIKVFFTVSIFWSLYDQSGSSWVLQGDKMDPYFLGYKIEASQLQAINPILIMLLIPVFGYWIYPGIEKLGYKMTSLRKMSIGMVMAAASFICCGIIQYMLDAGVKLNIAWQFVPYLIITCSEIMVSITGLEFAYTQAPRTMKSTIMSFWLMTVFVGNLFTAYIDQINIFSGGSYFMFFAAMMFLISLIFIIAASRYQVREYIEQGPTEAGLEPSPSVS